MQYFLVHIRIYVRRGLDFVRTLRKLALLHFVSNIHTAKRRRKSDDNGVWLTFHSALRPGFGREDASEEIVVELYDGRANTESDSIDRFTPVVLGSFKLKTEDVLAQLENRDSLESVSRAVNLSESEGLQGRACNEVTECRRDGWFGGIARREGSQEPGLKVAVRLESWRFGGCGAER